MDSKAKQDWLCGQYTKEGLAAKVMTLEAERDQLRNELDGYKKGIRDEVAANNERCQRHLDYQDRLTAERDALAAHVERLHHASVAFSGECDQKQERIGDAFYIPVAEVEDEQRELLMVTSEKPVTSLAQRDARVAYEALEEVAKPLSVKSDELRNAATYPIDVDPRTHEGIGITYAVDAIESLADEYRQQAEAGES